MGLLNSSDSVTLFTSIGILNCSDNMALLGLLLDFDTVSIVWYHMFIYWTLELFRQCCFFFYVTLELFR